MEPCIFCDIAAHRAPATRIYETDQVVAFFTHGPVAPYHTLVIPKRHARNIFDVSEDDLAAVTSAMRNICRAFKTQLGIEDLQIINSNGLAGQQDVFHLHFHIVPRRTGDGQDIVWTENPTLVSRFADLAAQISIDD